MRSLTVSFVVILLLAIYCYEEVYGRVYFNIIPLLENKYGGFLKSSSSSKFTSFENYSKISYLNFGIFHQFFVLLKLTYLVTRFDRKLHVFKNSPKRNIFNLLLSTQNVNVARFARNVECETFFCDFQTLCSK